MIDQFYICSIVFIWGHYKKKKKRILSICMYILFRFSEIIVKDDGINQSIWTISQSIKTNLGC
jgi:hypothetical protein